MKTIRIYCKICKSKLTDELFEVNSNSLKLYDNVDAIEKNKFSILTENNNKELVVAIETYYLKNHRFISRFSGCCGSSGLDGMNKTCENGHEVATEISDCWTPHYIIFNLDKIVVKEVIDDYKVKIISF
jgi:hypothetical protein